DYVHTTAFADLNLDIGSQWNVEAGVEHFYSSDNEHDAWDAHFFQPKTPSSNQSSAHKNNFKGGVKFKPHEKALVSLSYAEGFREGGFNFVPASASPLVPHSFQPDSLKNFELGWKTVWGGGRLVWDGAAYYMRWVGYQVPIYDLQLSPSSFNANIGDARIYGSETSLQVRPAEG